MEQAHDRLRLALKRSKLTQSQAVERYGWNRNTLKGNLNGNSVFGWAAAKEYGRAFGVRPEWLMDGIEPMLPAQVMRRDVRDVPVISWVAAGGLADHAAIDPDSVTEQIALSGLPAGDYFATDVKGDSMDRISPEGSRLVVNAGDRALVRGKPYLFSHNGSTTYKLWEPVPVPRLEPYSTNPANKPIFLSEENWHVIGRVYRSILMLD